MDEGSDHGGNYTSQVPQSWMEVEVRWLVAAMMDDK